LTDSAERSKAPLFLTLFSQIRPFFSREKKAELLRNNNESRDLLGCKYKASY
jgi:hypothetical protein